jgi:hypothetical protein
MVEDGTRSRLLGLAHDVERSVPGDCQKALSCLRLMRNVLSEDLRPQECGRGSAPTDPPIELEKLSFVVAQLERSVARGHVLAVRGLDRQVERYLGATHPRA